MVNKRNTWQREAVRAAMKHERGFTSAQKLYDRMRADGMNIGLATVYRTLSTMAESGEADTLNSPEGENLFRFCATQRHHHHLICRYCGFTQEIEALGIEAWAHQVAERHGFIKSQHIIDIFGVCPECRNNSAEATSSE